MDATPEEWRPVVGASDYYVSNHGRVISTRRGSPRLMTLTPKSGVGRGDYLCVTVDGRKRHVHDLVASAFIGPRPQGQEVAHWDGDGHNNNVSNLHYATKAENNADRYRHGTHYSKLSDDQVAAIRQRYGPYRKHMTGRVTLRALADEYGVTYGHIGRIVREEGRTVTQQMALDGALPRALQS